MKHQFLFPSRISSFITIITLVFISNQTSVLSQDDPQYETCANTAFKCGNMENLRYPFWSTNDRPKFCGHPKFELFNCFGTSEPKITIESVAYRVIHVAFENHTLTVARADLSETLCPEEFRDTTLDTTFFEFAPETRNLTLNYKCPVSPIPNRFSCPGDDSDETNIYISPALGTQISTGGDCSESIDVSFSSSSIGRTASSFNLSAALASGFGIKWKANERMCRDCEGSNGVCGSDQQTGEFACYCKNGSSLSKCSAGNSSKKQLQMAVGLSVAGAFILLMFIGGFACFFVRRRKTEQAKAVETQTRDISTQPSSKAITEPYTNFFRSTPSGTSYSHSKSDLEKGSTYFGVQVFSYAELEEGTDNFDASRELGEGGFGTVYYGKLHDGRVVAVKRLYENSFKRVEQFMNEVEILTKLHHPNLVKLYGCTSRRSKELLLVYEYISNGTVADHLHGNRSKSGPLSWPVRLNIAIETAEALAYLHRTDIIHRDVKTNNILLDDQFRVKVADFGLSKLFPTDVTHVSTAPQGTPGYVDPEYYQCYHLTTKSDVYSFGVVLIELLSSLQAVDTSRHRHDINLANMAITKIQSRSVGELVDRSLGFEEDEEVRRMATDMAELAFRCIQQERDMRPSMEEAAAALRAIRGEDPMVQVAEVVDIRAEDVGLLRNVPPPLSPDSSAADKWMD